MLADWTPVAMGVIAGWVIMGAVVWCFRRSSGRAAQQDDGEMRQSNEDCCIDNISVFGSVASVPPGLGRGPPLPGATLSAESYPTYYLGEQYRDMRFKIKSWTEYERLRHFDEAAAAAGEHNAGEVADCIGVYIGFAVAHDIMKAIEYGSRTSNSKVRQVLKSWHLIKWIQEPYDDSVKKILNGTSKKSLTGSLLLLRRKVFGNPNRPKHMYVTQIAERGRCCTIVIDFRYSACLISVFDMKERQTKFKSHSETSNFHDNFAAYAVRLTDDWLDDETRQLAFNCDPKGVSMAFAQIPRPLDYEQACPRAVMDARIKEAVINGDTRNDNLKGKLSSASLVLL